MEKKRKRRETHSITTAYLVILANYPKWLGISQINEQLGKKSQGDKRVRLALDEYARKGYLNRTEEPVYAKGKRTITKYQATVEGLRLFFEDQLNPKESSHSLTTLEALKETHFLLNHQDEALALLKQPFIKEVMLYRPPAFVKIIREEGGIKEIKEIGRAFDSGKRGEAYYYGPIPTDDESATEAVKKYAFELINAPVFVEGIESKKMKTTLSKLKPEVQKLFNEAVKINLLPLAHYRKTKEYEAYREKYFKIYGRETFEAEQALRTAFYLKTVEVLSPIIEHTLDGVLNFLGEDKPKTKK